MTMLGRTAIKSLDLFQPRLGQTFRDELTNRPWSAALGPLYDRLIATDAAIYERLDGQQLFSSTLWDLCAPRFERAELWHYTSLATLEKIIRTREIWLHCISNRVSEGELQAFANQFGYHGLTEFEGGLPRTHALARDLFYLSLTQENDPGEMWSFGEVRLLLRIVPQFERSQLRKMAYRSGPDHPLQVLRAFTKQRFDRELIPWGVSRQAAFFLDSYFSYESETRLLVKRFEENTDLDVRKSGTTEAIALPLGEANPRAEIVLLRVEAETPEAFARATALLRQVPEWKIPASVFIA